MRLHTLHEEERTQDCYQYTVFSGVGQRTKSHAQRATGPTLTLLQLVQTAAAVEALPVYCHCEDDGDKHCLIRCLQNFEQ